MVIYDDIVFCKIDLTLGIAYGSEAYEIMVGGWNYLACSGEAGGRLGRPKSAAPLDWCGWPLAVPTVILGSVGPKLIVGAFFEK